MRKLSPIKGKIFHEATLTLITEMGLNWCPNLTVHLSTWYSKIPFRKGEFIFLVSSWTLYHSEVYSDL